jgi:hypothetical protein
MIASFGGSIASRADTTGCAGASHSGFHTSIHQVTKAQDTVATTQLFKLFLVIGWEAKGLEAYASFAVDLVKVQPPASAQSTFFPDFLLSVGSCLNDLSSQRRGVGGRTAHPGEQISFYGLESPPLSPSTRNFIIRKNHLHPPLPPVG